MIEGELRLLVISQKCFAVLFVSWHDDWDYTVFSIWTEQCSEPLLVDDDFGDYTTSSQYIGDYNNPIIRGIPMNQPV